MRVLCLIHSDRYNNCVNQTVLHGVVTSFVDVEQYKKKGPLQLYEEVFEVKFLRETGAYYRSEAAKLKDECSCSDYMEKVSNTFHSLDYTVCVKYAGL